MQTKIHYMYRDACNYKFIGEFIVDGRVSAELITPFLYEDEYFIPHLIGLPHLLNMPMNGDDHYLHTIISIEECESKNPQFTPAEFLSKLEQAFKQGWPY